LHFFDPASGDGDSTLRGLRLAKNSVELLKPAPVPDCGVQL
jgi:hypothetical protein